MDNRLFLLDAYALIFRAYYALIKSPRITSTGINTNAQFGFVNTLLDILKKEKPTHLAVAFDPPGPTLRVQEHDFYKAHRDETPEDLIAAVPYIKAILKAMHIPILEVAGYEADDVIGTVAHQAAAEGHDVYMVTPDKDYGQLVSDKVFIWKPPAFGNKEEILGVPEILSKWGIKRVDQVIDLLGLMGDAADNIPGIKGVGEKTAVKLLEEYDTLEGVLENAANVKGKMGEKIAAGKEDAIISKKLATIYRDVPIQFNETQYLMEEPDKEALAKIFEELEFRTLGKRLLGDSFNIAEEKQSTTTINTKGAAKAKAAAAPSLFGLDDDNDSADAATNEDAVPTNFKTIKDVAHNYITVNDDAAHNDLIKKLSSAAIVCFDTETTGTDANLAELVGMSFSIERNVAYYIPLSANREECVATLKMYQSLFEQDNITWVGHNLKYDLLMLKWYGFALKGEVKDTMLAHYLIEPEGKRSMDVLSEQFLQYEPISITSLIGEKGKNQGSMRDVAINEITEYAAEDADITLQLHQVLMPKVLQKEVDKVYNEVECPLVPVLTDMEFEGVRIDADFLNEYSMELETELINAEESVFAQAGVRFNLGSPKQLGEVLFDHLKLDPNAKKTGKSGQYATGEEVLSRLAVKHKIVDDILNFREFSKLKSTYVDALPALVHPITGRVHTSYNQAVAVTGRLSSNNPNLQNIPIRTERGRRIRKAFVPRDAQHTLISADYSQIELRIVAAMANDTNMIAAFKENKDIHTATAAKVFGVEEKEVTKEMRRNAKAVNFGIIYGQSAFGLSENLGISRTEAKTIIDNYLREFSSIKSYMDTQMNYAREYGYVETLMGRKRWLRDINSSNQTVRGFAERNAINMPIQGTAADMIKLAMIRIHKAMKEASVKSKMILQVHDELIFDTHESEVKIMKDLILSNMQEALVLPNGVPVVAEVGFGANWLEAH
jgi:DNA polymerase I